MQKSLLETFIRKYSLSGECEASHWYSNADAKTLTVRAHSDTKTVILKITLKQWEGVETCQLALPSSLKLKSMLQPIGDEITFTLNKIHDKITSFTISDPDCEAICTVADYDAFPETLDTDTAEIPTEFEVEVKLTSEFIARLMKSISALNDAKDFVLINNKKGGLDMIINYEETNTNRIRIPVPTLPDKDKMENPMGFSTTILKSIITANENIENAILKVSSRGIAAIGFDDDLFKSTYFLFPTRVIE